MALLNPFESLDTRTAIHPREQERQSCYRAYLFGQFRLFRQQTSIAEQMQRRNKTASLLKWFLLNPGKSASADEFLDLFWPDLAVDAALGNLHVTMHCLRRLLQPELKTGKMSRFIHRRANNFYWFELDESWWIDAVEIHHFFNSAHTCYEHGSYDTAAYYYRKVIGCAGTGFLADTMQEAWIEQYRLRYEHLYMQALQQMIKICTDRNQLEDVLEYAYQVLDMDPYNQNATKAIIDTYLQQGNIDAARRMFNAYRAFFQHKLGVEPGRDFHQLSDRISQAAY